MAKHEINIRENSSATREGAAYVGSYVSKDTVKLPEFTAFLAAKCGLPTIQVQTIITAAFEAIEDLEKETLTRIQLDGFSIHGNISGSFPSSDAAFDSSRNTLELVLRLDDSIRLALVDVTPKILGDGIGTKLRVDNVMDLVNERPLNLIHGNNVFRVAGFNMVLSDEGADAFLQDSVGATYPLVIDEVVSKQLFKAHVSGAIVSGDYKLVVKSRAGLADGPLQTSFRRVKVLVQVDPIVPVITKAGAGSSETEIDSGFEDSWNPDSFLVAEGENLTLDATRGDQVLLKFQRDGAEQTYRVPTEACTSAEDGQHLAIAPSALIAAAIPEGTSCHAEYTIRGRTLAREFSYMA